MVEAKRMESSEAITIQVNGYFHELLYCAQVSWPTTPEIGKKAHGVN